MTHSAGPRPPVQRSLGSPESIEGFMAFKEPRSPDWLHPDLRIDGRL
jgi:hypothetical protein